MNPEELFLSHLPLIEQICRFVCQRHKVSGPEAEDFSSIVKLKLIEDDYLVIRRFEGRSQIATYLNTVIARLFSDYRVRMWGKWRPSAQAKRLGLVAISLERLIYREGYSFHEACQTLTTGLYPECSPEELEAIYARLPNRVRRPMVVDEPIPEDAITTERDPEDDEVSCAERNANANTVNRIINEAMEGLGHEDRLILRLRYADFFTLGQIGRFLKTDTRKLHKRISRTLQMFRMALEAEKIRGLEVEAIILRGDFLFYFGLRSATRGNPDPSPSLSNESGEFADGARPLLD